MPLRKTIVVGGAVVSLLALAACGGSAGGGVSDGGSTAGGGSGMIAQLSFPSEADSSVGGLVNYNPLSPKPLTTNWIYEPLIVRNNLTCTETPWLATKATWEGATKLTFDIRDGVKWSDGQPFTAKDVAFTFNLGKTYKAADKAGVWSDTFGSPASSVEASGNKVVLTFSGNAAGKYEGIISTKILPEHLYGRGRRPEPVRRQGARRHRPVQGRLLQRPPAHAGPARRLLAGRQDQGAEARARGHLRRVAGRPEAALGRAGRVLGRDPQPAEDLRRERPGQQQVLVRAERLDRADDERHQGAVQRRQVP